MDFIVPYQLAFNFKENYDNLVLRTRSSSSSSSINMIILK